jgi:LmbE family N-acetylglucosaminyl deacetylase
MNAREFVFQLERLIKKGKSLSPEKKIRRACRKNSADVPNVLIFSPHPDDECIIGALPLRLLRETKWNVVNVTVTLGSKRTRQKARLRELKNACNFLGFDLIVAGLNKINFETRKKNRSGWNAAVKIVSTILREQNPRVIFLPHENDVHPTHVGVHFLVLDALKTLPNNFHCYVVETEFWGQIAQPNLLVESSSKNVADLVAALACHAGEVRRNAYHARLPAWMVDNVRRGAELVGGQGEGAPNFTFGTIYNLKKWRGGKWQKIFTGGKFLSARENPVILFD